ASTRCSVSTAAHDDARRRRGDGDSARALPGVHGVLRDGAVRHGHTGGDRDRCGDARACCACCGGYGAGDSVWGAGRAAGTPTRTGAGAADRATAAAAEWTTRPCRCRRTVPGVPGGGRGRTGGLARLVPARPRLRRRGGPPPRTLGDAHG